MSPVGGKRWKWRNRGLWACIVGCLLFAVTLAVRAMGAPDAAFNRAVGWANIGAFFLAALGLAIAIWGLNRPDADPAKTADSLAATGLKAEGHALRELLFAGRDPGHRANVTFQSEGLVQFRSASTTGDLKSVEDFYTNSASGRMVVLGEPGAGKTVLALTLICRLLEHRQTLDDQTRSKTPVPVRFDLTGWDTARGLEDWLTEALLDRFGGLTRDSARGLVDANLVLPVLDGLDEMDLSSRQPTRSRAAIRQLNKYLAGGRLLPVVVTCRRQEYAQIGEELVDAVEVVINPLSPDQIRTDMAHELAPKSDQEARAAWKHLNKRDEVLGLLKTPWSLTLLAVYLRDGGPSSVLMRQPAEQSDAFNVRVWQALLDKYIPARTRSSDDTWYSPEQVRRWCTGLAANLDTDVDILLTDIWRVGGAGRVRTLQAVLSVALLIALTAISVLSLPDGNYQDMIDEVLYSVGHPSAIPAVRWIGAGGFVVMIVFAIRRIVTLARSDTIAHAIRPIALGQIRTQQGRRQFVRSLVPRLVFGIVVGIVFGIVFGLLDGLLDGLVFGLVVGLLAATAFGVLDGLGARDPSLTSPVSAVYSDLAIWLAVGLTAILLFGPGFGLGVGLGFGLVLGLGAVWIRYMCGLSVAAVQRSLPLRLARFLGWAERAGILRRSGPAYQFRHLTLRDHLQVQGQDNVNGPAVRGGP